MSHTFMTCVWPMFSISKCIFTMNLCLGKIAFALWHKHTKFGTWVYHHETTCCVNSWPVYDLDLWPICGWRGISLVSFTHSFYLVLSIVSVMEELRSGSKLNQCLICTKWLICLHFISACPDSYTVQIDNNK